MRDNNKRKREDEPYYIENENRSIVYQEIPTDHTPTVEQSPTFNQAVLLNQPIIQNQQLLYQFQRSNDQQQNLVYLLVPSNENLQVQPVTIVQNEQQNTSNQYVVNPQLNNHNENETELILPDDGSEYYVDNIATQKNVQYNSTKHTKNNYVNEPQKEPDNTTKQHLYRCDYKGCSQSFYSLYQRKLHLDTHIFPENNEFKCSICNMVFEKAIERNKHVETHAIPATYHCKECQKYFAYYTVLIKHLEDIKCSMKNPVSCYFCKIKIVDGDNLIKHHQLAMKQCACGMKICGIQTFELHRNICGMMKNSRKVQVPLEKKRGRKQKT